jgi:large conductance mechanosensitive channel
MQRLRETLAHGGVAVLAVVFALAYATVNLANAVANEVVSVLYQTIYDDSEGPFFEFTVWGADVSYSFILQSAIVLALIAALLFVLWHFTRNSRKSCPECQSDVPERASVCRYCTAELPAGAG